MTARHGEAFTMPSAGEEPSSGRKKKGKGKRTETEVPLSSYGEQLRDARRASRSGVHERVEPTEIDIVDTVAEEIEEGRRSEQLEQAASVRGKREEWEAEAAELERIADRSPEEDNRLELLMAKVGQAERMEARAEEVENLNTLESEIDELNRQIEEDERSLQTIDEEIRAEKEEIEAERKGAEHERTRLTTLQEQLEADPTDEKREEAERITRHLMAADESVAKRQKKVTELQGKAETIRKGNEEQSEKRKALVAGAVASKEKIGDLSKSIDKTDVALEDAKGKKEKPAVQKEAKAPAEQPKAKEEKGVLKTLGGIGRKTAGAGWMATLGIGTVVGIAAVPFRFVETFFKRLYTLTMHPGKFFSEIGSKYKEKMADPPKGKGKIKGFFSATAWFFAGDKPYVEKPEEKKPEEKKK